ncbi:MAG: 16S rRNA (cytosine(1402)-N(4))-methyltransferase RsmH [bacterium]|nr:16S rRNA (cytosine(1402)-N(4))-methyltransferase RsmH [bacterium]
MGQTSPDSVHLPVMVEAVVGHLVRVADGAYLDLTAGLGGHLLAFSKSVDESARLYGVDRDGDAVRIAIEKLKDVRQHCRIVKSSYVDILDTVARFDDHQFDGILLDLGLSSLQLDTASRGFSHNEDGPLDMRFDQEKGLRTAADLVNGLSQSQLADLFRDYGEERRSAGIAAAIVRERQKEMILTTAQLKSIVLSSASPAHQKKTLSRIFQALRIAVNGELDGLSNALPGIISLLNERGRLAVLAYHSLEDRLVKRFFQQQIKGCTCPPDLPVCVCGKTPSLKAVTRKALFPSQAEIDSNPRARSARLRVVERI